MFQAQIHLVGNPVSCCLANLALLAYQLLAAGYLLRRRRGFRDLPEGTQPDPAQLTSANGSFQTRGGGRGGWTGVLSVDASSRLLTSGLEGHSSGVNLRACVCLDAWDRFVRLGCVCVGGWLVNFVPFLLMEKTLFLYHYLPALCWLLVLGPALAEHVHTHLLRYTHPALVAALCCVSSVLITLCVCVAAQACGGPGVCVWAQRCCWSSCPIEPSAL